MQEKQEKSLRDSRNCWKPICDNFYSFEFFYIYFSIFFQYAVGKKGIKDCCAFFLENVNAVCLVLLLVKIHRSITAEQLFNVTSL